MERAEMNKLKLILFWLLFGAIASFSIAAMMISGTFNLDCFYDTGEVSEVFQRDLNTAANGSDLTYYAYQNDWEYLDVKVKNINVQEVNWKVYFYSIDGDAVAIKLYTLIEGENFLELPKQSFGYITIDMLNQKDVIFELDHMKFCEKYPRHDGEQIAFLGGIICAVYIVLSLFFYFLIIRKHKNSLAYNKHAILDLYQSLICFITRKIPIKKIKLTNKQRHIIRICCFLFWLTYNIWIQNSGIRKEMYIWNCIITIIIVLIVVIVSIDQKLKRKTWNYKVAIPWFALWVMACISDFIVPKTWSYLGYVFLLFFGIAFYLWHNMKNPEDIIRDIVSALHIHFIGIILYCFFCRPQIENYSYLGICGNSNIFSFYLITILAAWLAASDNLLEFMPKNKRKVFLLSLEACLIFFFLWKTQCRGAFIAAFIMTAIFIFRQLRCLKGKRNKFPFFYLILILLLIFPVYNICDWITLNIPYKFGTVVIYEIDNYMPQKEISFNSPFIMKVFASGNELIDRLQANNLDELFSGRITIWKSYIRQMNLLGHNELVKIKIKTYYSHNMFLEIMYRYGVFTLIPYVFMWIGAMESAIRYMKIGKRKENGCVLFPIMIFTGFLILSMNDALEQPFRDTIWLIAYFIIGLFMFKPDKKMET